METWADAAQAPTLPRPGVSFTLLTALSRQGGAGGGDVWRIPLKLVAKRGGSATEVEGRCFFFLDERFNFWAALEGKSQKKDHKGKRMAQSDMLGSLYGLSLKEAPSSYCNKQFSLFLQGPGGSPWLWPSESSVVHAMLNRFSHVRLSVTLWTAACQAPLSMEFSRQQYWNGLPFPPPGEIFRAQGSNPRLLHLLHWKAGSLPLAPWMNPGSCPILHMAEQCHDLTWFCSLHPQRTAYYPWTLSLSMNKAGHRWG